MKNGRAGQMLAREQRIGSGGTLILEFSTCYQTLITIAILINELQDMGVADANWNYLYLCKYFFVFWRGAK